VGNARSHGIGQVGGAAGCPDRSAVTGHPLAKMGPVSEFLVIYLDRIDERLLDYLDEDEELRIDTARRLRYYTTALLDGSITPTALNADWPDWYDLAPAFVAAYAPEEVGELEEAAALLEGPKIGDDAPITGAERAYLLALERALDMYPEMPSTEEG
jgi:hypothetical protein